MYLEQFKKNVMKSLLILGILLVLSAFVFTPNLYAAEETIESGSDSTAIWICWAAAAAFGFGAIGASIAISKVGSAAMGAISERPEIATNALIFIALAEGLVVFGFITALMILGKV